MLAIVRQYFLKATIEWYLLNFVKLFIFCLFYSLSIDRLFIGFNDMIEYQKTLRLPNILAPFFYYWYNVFNFTFLTFCILLYLYIGGWMQNKVSFALIIFLAVVDIVLKTYFIYILFSIFTWRENKFKNIFIVVLLIKE